MSGTPSQKKDPDPMVGGRVPPDERRALAAVLARMKRSEAALVQEFIRAFLEYTADGRTPNFPLIVSAESYKDASGEVVVPHRSNHQPTDPEQLSRIEAYCAELVRLNGGSEIVKSFSAALKGAADRSQSRPPTPPASPESSQTERRSHTHESPPPDGRNRPGGQKDDSRKGA